jgi:hypothetical protein
MKTLIIKIFPVLLISLSACVAPKNKVLSIKRTPASEEKTIVFNYTHKGKPLKLTFKGVTWEVALKEGANKCMDYYTDGKRAQVEEELYLDLIDVCVNPR